MTVVNCEWSGCYWNKKQQCTKEEISLESFGIRITKDSKLQEYFGSTEDDLFLGCDSFQRRL